MYGVEGCPSGQTITTLEECIFAISTLGFPATPTWTGFDRNRQGLCHIKETSTGFESGYNYKGVGKASSDIAPICIKGSQFKNLILF